MPSSAVIDLAIGMSFVFGVTAALASVVTELIARLVGLRGAYLLSGLRELVDSGGTSTDLSSAERDYRAMQDLMRNRPASGASFPVAQAFPAPPSMTGALLGGPILSSQGMTGQITSRHLTIRAAPRTGSLPKMTSGPQARGLWRQRRSLPSYISAKSFAEAVIDFLVPDAAGQTTIATLQRNVGRLPEGLPFKSSLQALLKNAGGDVSRFRTDVEHWYDDHMDRVSGWYKRHVAKITLVIGAILIMLLNINALTIGRTLYTDSAVNAAVSQVAAKGTDCSANPTRQECLANLQGQLSAVAVAGLPIGWSIVRDCRQLRAQCNWLDQRGVFSRHGNSGWQLVLVLVGFLITSIVIVPGARFWFDLLGRLGSLRQTGPKPAPPAS